MLRARHFACCSMCDDPEFLHRLGMLLSRPGSSLLSRQRFDTGAKFQEYRANKYMELTGDSLEEVAAATHPNDRYGPNKVWQALKERIDKRDRSGRDQTGRGRRPKAVESAKRKERRARAKQSAAFVDALIAAA